MTKKFNSDDLSLVDVKHKKFRATEKFKASSNYKDILPELAKSFPTYSEDLISQAVLGYFSLVREGIINLENVELAIKDIGYFRIFRAFTDEYINDTNSKCKYYEKLIDQRKKEGKPVDKLETQLEEFKRIGKRADELVDLQSALMEEGRESVLKDPEAFKEKLKDYKFTYKVKNKFYYKRNAKAKKQSNFE